MTRARILVMDDDPLFRSLLAATLRKDYLVSVAADGTEGYSKAVDHLPDLAVIDLQMPVCDGLSVVKAFRANPTLRNVPVMILTGDNSKESVLAAIQLGIVDYVIKSAFNKTEFAAKIARLLANPPKVTPEPAAEAAPAAKPKPAQRRHASGAASPKAAAARPATTTASPDDLSAVAANTSNQNLQSILDNWD